MNQIFSYKNYRDYLKDYYAYMKRHSAGFSHRSFSKSAAIESPNYLKLIMDGKRNLVGDTIFRFIKALNLDEREGRYFDLLVKYNQCHEPQEKKFYASWLEEFRASTKGHRVAMRHNKIDFAWYIPIAEILLEARSLEEAPRLLRDNLGFQQSEAENLIDHLMKSQAIILEDGRFILQEEHSFFRDRDANRMSFKQYILGHLNFASQNIDDLYSRGKFVCHTFTAFEKDQPQIDSLLSDFIDNLIGLSQHRNAS